MKIGIITDRNSMFFDEKRYNLACAGKKGYDSRWQAQYAVDETERMSRGAVKLGFYFCKYCGKFHLTST